MLACGGEGGTAEGSARCGSSSGSSSSAFSTSASSGTSSICDRRLSRAPTTWNTYAGSGATLR
eukprot:scaffold5030_cov76-Pinguiococcus_pyrenoidosus.AAC.1